MSFAVRFTQWNAGFLLSVDTHKKVHFHYVSRNVHMASGLGEGQNGMGANEPPQWNTIKTPLRIH